MCCTRRTGATWIHTRWPAAARTPRCAVTGWLPGWRITFGGEGWDGALPTLVEDPDDQVFVALYDVTPTDESVLDQWESAYHRALPQSAGPRRDP